jgi:acyl carrier protein
MLDEFKKILKENYNITEVELASDFKKDFGLSSFDFINLICLIEEKYGIVIVEEEYLSLNTVGDLIKYIEKSLRQKSGKS